MVFNWYDVLLLAPLLAIVGFETRQELGRSLLDALAVVSAFYLTANIAGPAAPVLRLSLDPVVNGAVTFLAIFGLLLVVLLFGARFVHDTCFQLSADAFDPLFG